LFPEYSDRIASTLVDPDQIRRSSRFGGARLFSRWYGDVKGGKHVVIVVVSAADIGRHWIVTAYMARALVAGDVEWQRN
jgi:hypothetical protein